jgi:hypothetical protein
MDLSKLVKAALPAAAGAFLGPAAGSLFPGATGIMASPFLQRALTSGAVGLLTGQKPKDAILSSVMGGVGGQFLDGRQAAMQQGLGASSKLANLNQSAMEQAAGLAKKSAAAGAGLGSSTASAPVAKTMSGELLRSLGMAGDEEGNLLFKIMNSQLGEGLAAGLIARLLAGDDEPEGPSKGSYESRAFGAGGPGGKMGGINYADGGEAYFPRRNGGIDPSEGSGTKDDVPALLLAGEFVHTRDANEGLGKMMGAKNKDEAARMGIEAQYKLMDAFERMA